MEVHTSKGAENYSYCHLISGIDLPIKSQDYIHDFFEQNEGKEFVGFTCDKFDDDDLKWKTRYYHVLCQYQRNPNFILRKTTRLVHHLFIRLQKLFHFTRQQDIEFRKGCNWCSLSNKFVKYLVDNKQIVYERFNHMFCADEIFIQTMLWNSAFKDNIYDQTDEYNGCMREIDWQRGNPYVWKTEDYNYLTNSQKIFARKFSTQHIDIIQKIKKQYSN